MNIRNQIRDILNKNLNFNSIGEFVNSNLTYQQVGCRLNSCYNDLNDLFNQLPSITNNQTPGSAHLGLSGDDNEQQLRKDAILELVLQIFQQQHHKKQLILFRIIHKLINARMIEVRFVCEYMLNSLIFVNSHGMNQNNYTGLVNSSQTPLQNLNINTKLKNSISDTPTHVWCSVLEFIQKLIPGLDYKSCRDIFKMLLEVAKKIPHSNSSIPPPLENENVTVFTRKHRLEDDYDKNMLQKASRVTDDIRLESLYETISYLLDHENYLMPRYLAINEIKSVLTFGKESYHQRFHYIFTTFIESFIPTAHLISVSGRDKLLPIVGSSNLYSPYSFWRFNPANCKFNTSGPLPYFKHVSKPHRDVFFYLLRQNTPQYLLLSLMSLHRNTIKNRFPLFEEEFAYVIFETMKHTEKIPNNNKENLRIWNNLVNQLVNLPQIIHLPSLIKTLSNLIKDKVESFEESRNWLSWFLLNTITSYMNRNRIPEFSDLFEILYKDEEILPNPDLTSPISVVTLAPLSIWIHLNLRMVNQNQESNQSGSQTTNSSKSSRALITPEIIQNHSSILQESMNTQNFQDFRLAICMNAYSTETTFFSPPFNNLLEQIGKNASANANSSNSVNSIFTNHQPLSFGIIGSFTLHVRTHTANYLTCLLIQKPQICKVLTVNIPASIVETFARLLIFDPDNFIKFFTQNLWKDLILAQPNNLPQIPAFQQKIQNQSSIQSSFLYQQLNLLIELIAFRLKHLSFTHRTTFLFLLNTLFMPQHQLQQQQHPMNYIKHSQIYYSAQIAMLKLLTSFTGSDHYELLNSILTSTKHGPKYFINPDSEEINKAIIIIIARAIVLTSTDLHPLENKDKDDALKTLLNEIMKNTPLYFPDHIVESFPKVLSDFFKKDQINLKNERFYLDSSNNQYKGLLSSKVDEDYKRFIETRPESHNQLNFQNIPNQMPVNTVICMLFKLLQDETVQNQNFNTYLNFIYMNLNGLENKKFSQAMRTFCDYLIIEATNKSKNVIDNYASIIVNMINVFNIFSYDRLLFIMTFRNFDCTDFQLALEILNALFCKSPDFRNKHSEFVNLWNSICGENGDWNPTFYSQYIRMHPEKFFYEGLKEKIKNVQLNDPIINTYYGNMPMRCVPILDFLNNRYIEHDIQSTEGDSLIDTLNLLYKFHGNRISYVYNTLMYYNNRFEANPTNKQKKTRILFLIDVNKDISSPMFTDIFRNCILSNQPLPAINADYYFHLIQKLVKRMLDTNQATEFSEYSSEFQNPSSHLLYTILCELICLELYTNDSLAFTRTISTSIFDLFFANCFSVRTSLIDKNELVYWINGAGLIISNLPESYWHSIYEHMASIMKTHTLLNSNDPSHHHASSKLFDHFDLFLAEEKNCFDEITLTIALFHSIWCHSSANHFQYFVKFLKERRSELIRTEAHFLFICKLIGPYLSKIHLENTNLLINLVEELYDMISIVDTSNEQLYHMETMCNFFYHLKYRHIGESIKEKIHSLMPDFRPELKKLFKYITSELNQQQVKASNSPQVLQQLSQSKLAHANQVIPKNLMNVS